MFHKKGLSDIDLKDKRVLLRADYNVPLTDGVIDDDYRIRMSVPTIEALLEQRCSIVIMSHLGRPESKVVPELSLAPVAKRLSELLGQEVKFAHDCIGRETVSMAHSLQPGEILLVENLRFHSEEVSDEENFAKELAKLGDVFVQDGFGVVHRAHASTHAITKLLPSVAGLLVENEVRQIIRATKHPKKPTVAIVGGAKIETKIELLDNLMPSINRLIIGGAMSNTFLAAMEMEVGKSLYDKDELEVARKIIQQCRDEDVQLILPLQDVAVAKEVNDKAKRRVVETENVKEDDIILDIGTKTIDSILENLKDAGTVIWNGPVGMIEIPAFMKGSEAIAKFITEHHIDSVVGGGDTVELVDELNLMDGFTHVSTGGGAALELMSGLPLPGVESLLDKRSH